MKWRVNITVGLLLAWMIFANIYEITKGSIGGEAIDSISRGDIHTMTFVLVLAILGTMWGLFFHKKKHE